MCILDTVQYLVDGPVGVGLRIMMEMSLDLYTGEGFNIPRREAL